MDPEEKKMLQDSLRIGEENHKMLRHIRRSQKLAFIMRIFYWIVIFGAAYGAYKFLQPYTDQAVKFIEASQNTINSFKNILPR